MLRLSARAGLGLAVIAASAATLSLAQPPPPGGSAPGQPGGAVANGSSLLDFTSIQNQWYWLRKEADAVQLLSSAPGEPGKSLLSGKGWTEVAVDEESIWLLQREDTRGSLLKLPRSGGAPTVMVPDLESPAGLYVSERRACWIESRSPAVSGLLYVPAAETRNVVRMRDVDGTVRDLGAMMGGTPPANGDLQGMMHLLYARHRRLDCTEFYLADLRRPQLQRVIVEAGLQEGIISHRGFIWTAPSEEASDPSVQRCVRRSLGEGSSASITDWLPINGTLHRLGSDIFYSEMALHRLPVNEGETSFVAELPSGRLASDGERIVLLDAPNGPQPVSLNRPGP